MDTPRAGPVSDSVVDGQASSAGQTLPQSRDFRVAANRVYFTFSRCREFVSEDCTLWDIMGYHLAYLPPTKYYVMCHERHADGGHHHHVYIEFQRKIDRSLESFEFMFDQRPQSQKISKAEWSPTKITEYIKKDGQWVEDGRPPLAPVVKANSVKVSDTIAKAVIGGITDEELYAQYPGYFMVHRRQIQEFRAVVEANKPRELLPFREVRDFDDSLQYGTFQAAMLYDLMRWVRFNVNNYPRKDMRQKHLWLWGPTKVGKSRLLAQLSSMVHTFDCPMDGSFNGFTDAHDLIVMDELEGQYTIAQMKRLCQGMSSVLKFKCFPGVRKTRNQPVIVTSNKSPEEIYHNVFDKSPTSLMALIERFVVIHIDFPFDLYPGLLE